MSVDVDESGNEHHGWFGSTGRDHLECRVTNAVFKDINRDAVAYCPACGREVL